MVTESQGAAPLSAAPALQPKENKTMITIDGKYTEARVFTDELEDLARTQIRDVCNHPAFEGSRVRIMPDVHAGAGCVIGFTAELKTDKVIPNLIGVDIGCGVLTARLAGLPDFSRFDERLRERVPFGWNTRSAVHQALLDDPELDDEISRICVDVLRTEKDRHRRSVGSLGGGNHFIEIAQGTEDAFLCIHSGSRNFGLKIAERYQKIAVATCPDAYLKERKKGLCYLQGEDTLNYMRDMKVAQRFAALNRRVMLHELLDDAADLEIFDTVHNYIAEDNVIRQGGRPGRTWRKAHRSPEHAGRLRHLHWQGERGIQFLLPARRRPQHVPQKGQSQPFPGGIRSFHAGHFLHLRLPRYAG